MNCAGPFEETFSPMAKACLRNGLHYLDITGELSVFEAAHKLDKEAKDAKIMILPGTGNDVVPTDCLAARLKRRLPTATHLTMGMGTIKEPKTKSKRPISHGTLKTMVGNLGQAMWVRREGKIVPGPAYLERKITLPRERAGEYSKVYGASIPWGDISTAYHSTAIPNVTFFFQVPLIGRWILWLFSFALFKWILGFASLRTFLQNRIPQGGPSEAHREETLMGFFGEVVDIKNGKMAVSLLRTEEGYKLTQLASVAVLQRVLKGDAPIGFRTPSTAYGEDFVTRIEGSKSVFEDLDIEVIPKG